jgi:hypothetical protein
MERRRRKKEPMPYEPFVRALEEELALSAEFDLPLTLLVVRAGEDLDPETAGRLLGVFRTAEFVTLPSPSELAVILPNTEADDARAVERRVRDVLPDADVGLATREPDEKAPDLLRRARGAREEP